MTCISSTRQRGTLRGKGYWNRILGLATLKVIMLHMRGQRRGLEFGVVHDQAGKGLENIDSYDAEEGIHNEEEPLVEFALFSQLKNNSLLLATMRGTGPASDSQPSSLALIIEMPVTDTLVIINATPLSYTTLEARTIVSTQVIDHIKSTPEAVLDVYVPAGVVSQEQPLRIIDYQISDLNIS
ncbi:hypothetical protein Tco_0604752 [Tanacetum coccineum]